jgi:DsbC/DsbD-like thiol-disulfide interchange protein
VIGEISYREHAGKALEALSPVISKAPAAVPMALIGLDQYIRSGVDLSTKQLAGDDAVDDLTVQTVSASVRVAESNLPTFTPGRELDAIITVKIQDGWHIYANPAGLPEMKPTTVGLDSTPNPTVSLVNVSYPAGDAKILGAVGALKVKLYEGKVEFTVRLKIADQVKPGAVVTPLKLSYQACNDRVCQAPAQLKIPLTVTVGH